MRNILPVDRWSLLALAASLAILSVIGWVDYVTIWPILVFYLVPQLLVATLMRGYWWVPLAFLETGVWLLMRYESPPPGAIVNNVRETWQTALLTAMQPLGVLLVVGFLCARLRHYSRSPDALTSSHDATGLLSASGLRETLSRRHTLDRLSQGPIAVLLLDVERRVSAYAGQSNEYAALVGAIIGKVVLEHARAADLCVRLSPNHFLVIMPNTDQSSAAAFNAAIQDALPEIARSLDDSVVISSLLLTSPAPVSNVNMLRAYAENRLITLKVLGLGRNHAETWPPSAAEPHHHGQPITAG